MNNTFLYTRFALARLLVLLAIRLIPMDLHGATFGATSRLWQANDRLKLRIADLRALNPEPTHDQP